MGLKLDKKILLKGPSGCGKTMIAKAIANESGANFYSVKGPELESKWVGQTEENLRKLFDEAANNKPAVIFIDEFDSIASKRGEDDTSKHENKVVNQLLTLIDGFNDSTSNVTIIAATNFPELLDPAITGRFSRMLEVPIPDKKGCKEILQKHLAGKSVADNINTDLLADTVAKNKLTGRDIEKTVDNAGSIAIAESIPAEQLDSDKPIDCKGLKITQANLETALNAKIAERKEKVKNLIGFRVDDKAGLVA